LVVALLSAAHFHPHAITQLMTLMLLAACQPLPSGGLVTSRHPPLLLPLLEGFASSTKTRQQHHHHQRTKGSTNMKMFTHPDNLDLLNLSTIFDLCDVG
jgi:hypothetical protein